ncbi:MAG: glycosyltransferase [Saprospiraceae bacterium]|nr:glycosyltransferase [Saprospiraceae bacterium]
MPGRLSICAIIAVRNEADYLKILLPRLAAQDIEVIIIDNESTDASSEIYDDFLCNPIIRIISLPYRNFFSLTDQMECKNQLMDRLPHDWIIHHDADEIMENRDNSYTLRQTIEEADDQGFNCLNFDEFVFVPEPGSNYEGRDYYAHMHRYYFFSPESNRLHRAFRRDLERFPNNYNGHRIAAKDLRLFPVNHTLRHYILLSDEHARRKYLGRRFDPIDLEKGWHGNRLSFSEENLLFPSLKATGLFRSNGYAVRELCRDAPQSTHFWEWDK